MANIPTIKETRRVLYNLQRRLNRIESIIRKGGSQKLSSYAIDKFQELASQGRIRDDIRKLTPQQRKEMYNDIVELSKLKSSTVKGAERYYKYWEEPMQEKYNKFTGEQKKLFTTMSNKIMEILSDKFRYEAYQIVATEIEKGNLDTVEKQGLLLKNLEALYRKVELDLGGKGSEHKHNVFVAKYIDIFLEQLK